MSGQSSYAELADVLDNLGLIVREARRYRGLSQRAAALQIGFAEYSTLSRVESGKQAASGAHIVAILRWLQEPAERSGGTT